jgi:tRNA (guanine-N7-)-methyltransferase
MVTIQFPDPHFKARHAKRRVVTPELVTTLARFMPTGATVFLQSDVQTVLDEMRLQFREQFEHFEDSQESVEDYVPENILGVPTEREISVLDKDLPVYRAVFKRTNSAVSDN